MNKLNTHKTGLALAAFFGLVHLLWSLCVAMGFAQGMLDFIYGMHFLNNPFTMQAFSWGGALMLVVITSVIGYVVGFVLSAIINKVAR